MKKLSLTFCFLTITATSFAQATKIVTNIAAGYTEKYRVLKSDENIRLGSYIMSNTYTGDAIATGFYKNNKRDSIWRYYGFGKALLAEGELKDGRRLGEWTIFGDKGNPVDKYDFTTNQLIFHKKNLGDSAMYRVINGADTLFTRLERTPIYANNRDWMFGTIAQILRMPADARARHIKGTVIVGFTIDENGHMRDIHINRGIGYGCDEEAIRVINVIADDWIPGVLNGKRVPVLTAVQVTFSAM